MAYEGQGVLGTVLTSGASGRVWESPFSRVQVGRFAIGPPGVGTGTLPLSVVSGPLSVAADRIQVGGPAIILVEWGSTLSLSDPCTFNIATTTFGAASKTASLPSPVNFGFGQTLFYSGTDPSEEVWLETVSASAPTITDGIVTLVKFPL